MNDDDRESLLQEMLQEMRRLTEAMSEVTHCMQEMFLRERQLEDLNRQAVAIKGELESVVSALQRKPPDRELLEVLDRARSMVAKKIELEPTVQDCLRESPKLFDRLIAALTVIFNSPRAQADLENFRSLAKKLRPDLTAEQWLKLVTSCPNAHLN